MLTNLLCSVIVTLTTNVTERFPTHMEWRPCGPNEYGELHQIGDAISLMCHNEVPDANPTNKWVRTTVTRWTRLEVEFKGQRWPIAIPETVSESEVEYVLRQEWEPKAEEGRNTPQAMRNIIGLIFALGVGLYVGCVFAMLLYLCGKVAEIHHCLFPPKYTDVECKDWKEHHFEQ